MVARHNKRIRWHGGGVCIDCGTRYPVTNAYKGNYCPDCHEAWIDRQRDDPPATTSLTPASPRVRPSERRTSNTAGSDESDDEG